ncbi:hypothetical protein ENUP19_0150G0021 [Entamoeba nuttalli]|uniref:TBC domain containing protein n=2 Tax=Entamoeba nuttalli TaxID=412467 RepID=K2HJ72_ENTNP|nr:TBC domain containing protein [Entamoeba nuttalli P19]EKE43054.1 TBC domain containing protein [Entamoeba nuttalli P19]|eukprot:XP_008854611.1 TBC domain containing protein [Entamoeba nuttalli P19]
MSKEVYEYYCIIEEPVVDIEALRVKVMKSGIPNNNKLRAKIWKLLLRYYRAEQKTWVSSEETYLLIYRKQKEKYYEEKKKEGEEKQNEKEMKNKKLSRIIDKDLARTNDGEHKEEYNNALRRILNILSNMQGGIPYVQGLNIIANVFYHVFLDASDAATKEFAEVSTLFCMYNLLNNIRDWFDSTKDMTNTGIRAAMGRVMYCVKQKNQRLANTINTLIDPSYYLFRWLTLLGASELPMDVTIKMWDKMFCEIRGLRYLFAFLASMILEIECLIGNFELTLNLLQHYPIKDFDRIDFTARIILRDVMRVNPARIDLNEKPVGSIHPFPSSISSLHDSP